MVSLLAPMGEQPTEGQQQQPTEGQQQQPTEGQQQQVQAPQYGEELSKAIQGLPAEHRTAVEGALANREAAWMNFARQLEGHVNGYERLKGLDEVIAPRLQAWAMQGATPAAAVNQLLALSDFATRDPKAFITWFAGNNNIDLSEVSEDIVPIDPQLQTLQQRVDTLTRALTGMQSGAQQGVQQQFAQVVGAFEAEQDASGQPLRPHFQEVAQHMLALVPYLRSQMQGSAPRDILQAAYDQAVYANPITRAKALAAVSAAQTAERTAQALKAKTAGQGMRSGAPASGAVQSGAIPNGSVREALEASFAFHS
jgi:hypothetical protein